MLTSSPKIRLSTTAAAKKIPRARGALLNAALIQELLGIPNYTHKVRSSDGSVIEVTANEDGAHRVKIGAYQEGSSMPQDVFRVAFYVSDGSSGFLIANVDGAWMVVGSTQFSHGTFAHHGRLRGKDRVVSYTTTSVPAVNTEANAAQSPNQQGGFYENGRHTSAYIGSDTHSFTAVGLVREQIVTASFDPYARTIKTYVLDPITGVDDYAVHRYTAREISSTNVPEFEAVNSILFDPFESGFMVYMAGPQASRNLGGGTPSPSTTPDGGAYTVESHTYFLGIEGGLNVVGTSSEQKLGDENIITSGGGTEPILDDWGRQVFTRVLPISRTSVSYALTRTYSAVSAVRGSPSELMSFDSYGSNRTSVDSQGGISSKNPWGSHRYAECGTPPKSDRGTRTIVNAYYQTTLSLTGSGSYGEEGNTFTVGAVGAGYDYGSRLPVFWENVVPKWGYAEGFHHERQTVCPDRPSEFMQGGTPGITPICIEPWCTSSPCCEGSSSGWESLVSGVKYELAYADYYFSNEYYYMARIPDTPYAGDSYYQYKDEKTFSVTFWCNDVEVTHTGTDTGKFIVPATFDGFEFDNIRVCGDDPNDMSSGVCSTPSSCNGVPAQNCFELTLETGEIVTVCYPQPDFNEKKFVTGNISRTGSYTYSGNNALIPSAPIDKIFSGDVNYEFNPVTRVGVINISAYAPREATSIRTYMVDGVTIKPFAVDDVSADILISQPYLSSAYLNIGGTLNRLVSIGREANLTNGLPQERHLFLNSWDTDVYAMLENYLAKLLGIEPPPYAEILALQVLLTKANAPKVSIAIY